MKPKMLYKTTIIIWSDFDPDALEIDALAQDAMTGESYCSFQESEEITDQTQFPDTEFFDSPDKAVKQ